MSCTIITNNKKVRDSALSFNSVNQWQLCGLIHKWGGIPFKADILCLPNIIPTPPNDATNGQTDRWANTLEISFLKIDPTSRLIPLWEEAKHKFENGSTEEDLKLYIIDYIDFLRSSKGYKLV